LFKNKQELLFKMIKKEKISVIKARNSIKA